MLILFYLLFCFSELKLNPDEIHTVFSGSIDLDSKLYDFSLTIPTQFLVKEGLAKTILRDAVKNIAPEKIIKNPRKVGFNAPLNDFIDFEKKEIKSFLLEDSEIYRLVNKDKVSKVFSNNLTNSFSKFLFNFINAKLFIENFQ